MEAGYRFKDGPYRESATDDLAASACSQVDHTDFIKGSRGKGLVAASATSESQGSNGVTSYNQAKGVKKDIKIVTGEYSLSTTGGKNEEYMGNFV